MKLSFLSVQRLRSPLTGPDWEGQEFSLGWSWQSLTEPAKPHVGAAQRGLISGSSFPTFSTAGVKISLWAQ